MARDDGVEGREIAALGIADQSFVEPGLRIETVACGILVVSLGCGRSLVASKHNCSTSNWPEVDLSPASYDAHVPRKESLCLALGRQVDLLEHIGIGNHRRFPPFQDIENRLQGLLTADLDRFL